MEFESVLNWGTQILVAAGLAFVFSVIYVAFGEAHSNRRQFARNFFLLAVITTVIIMIIKQSIALSLGLVGALSIVRFRAAIKEPEELTYLFMMIAIGIGVGAGQLSLITLFSLFVAAVIVVRHYLPGKAADQKFFNVNIISKKAKEEGPSSLTAILKKWCSRVALRRFDEDESSLDMLVYAEFKDESSLIGWRKELLEFDSSARISFLDREGVF